MQVAATPIIKHVSVAQTLDDAVAPVLLHHGFELILVEYLSTRRIVRLFIDRAAPEGADMSLAPGAQQQAGISLTHCTEVSRLVSDLIDAEQLMEDASTQGYTLEVSSPGLDRPLTKPKHYLRFVGHDIKVEAQSPIGSSRKRRVVAKLVALHDGDDSASARIDILYDNAKITLALSEITRAHLVPRFDF